MKRKCGAGFTLIKAVIVVMVGGILAVVALSSFFHFSLSAQTAATTEVADSLSSANTTNYAARSENATNGVSVTNCTSVPAALLGGVLPAGYTIIAAPIAQGSTRSCVLKGPHSTTATFSATGIH